MKYKPGYFKKILKESIKSASKTNLNEAPWCGTPNVQLYNYCYAHCQMQGTGPMPPQCPDNFAEECCSEIEGHCPEGMIDQDNSLWSQCLKCWNNPVDNATINTGEDCECCQPIEEEGCPEGMIDDTSPLWPLCIKCYTGSSDDSTITGTPPDCECCRPMDEPPEEKLTCYKCQKKGGNQVVAVQFPNSLSAWANFNFQGECPKGWTTNPNPCKPSGTAGMGISRPPRVRNKRRR